MGENVGRNIRKGKSEKWEKSIRVVEKIIENNISKKIF